MSEGRYAVTICQQGPSLLAGEFDTVEEAEAFARSIWGSGFSVSLPASLAVGSPNLKAIQPWATSWMMMAKSRGGAINMSVPIRSNLQTLR